MEQAIDIKADAQRVFDIIKDGGIAIVPNDTGYALCSTTTAPLRRIFDAKGRGDHKRNAMAADLQTQRTMLKLDKRGQAMVDTLILDHDLPLGVIGPVNMGHPQFRKLDEELRRASSAAGTVALLLNAGTFHNELTRLSREAEIPLLGSSANFSGTGTRFRVEDIPQELRAMADITIDHGLRRAHIYKRAGTIINFNTMQVIRIGAYYEMISEVLKRWFDVVLPPDPGLDALPSGHINEFVLKDVKE